MISDIKYISNLFLVKMLLKNYKKSLNHPMVFDTLNNRKGGLQ